CGDGPAKNRLIARWKCRGNMAFLPIQPAEKLSELLSAADIHILPQLGCAADLVLPSKLSGMLASGRPIIATAKRGTALANEVEEAGLVTPPEDLDALVEAIRGLAGDAELRQRLGDAGRSHVLRNWDKMAILRGFEEELMALASEGSQLSTRRPSALQLDAAE
ncbi:MAG: glycosyltransferase, partial [Alphaproteobacteria bacterium]